VRWRVREGRPFPLGATWDGLGVNFALFSAHATRVELCLFDTQGERELARIELPEHTDEVWHGAPFVPKAMVIDPAFTWGRDRPQPIPWDHTIIYEAHVKGLTQRHAGLPEALRGKIGALAEPLVVDYLQRLGITALEPLRIQGFIDGRQLVERGRPWHEAMVYELHVGTFTPAGTFRAVIERLEHLATLGLTAIELMPIAEFPGRRNWGYDGVLPFAPDARYGRPDDLKALVDAAHARGLMMLLDVVYNHFGPEGDYTHLYWPQLMTRRHATPWGAAVNYDDEGSAAVRELAGQRPRVPRELAATWATVVAAREPRRRAGRGRGRIRLVGRARSGRGDLAGGLARGPACARRRAAAVERLMDDPLNGRAPCSSTAPRRRTPCGANPVVGKVRGCQCSAAAAQY